MVAERASMFCPLWDSGTLLLPRVGARRASVMGDVQAAFLLLRLLPPPAPGTLRLTRHDGTGARRAADRQKAALMQRVAWHVVGAHEFAGAFARPVEQRIDLEQTALLIEQSRQYPRAIGGLVGAQPGDPGSAAIERPRQWRDLANRTTVEAGRDGGSEPVDALSSNQGFDGAVFGREGQDADAVATFGLGPDIIGLRKKPAGVERRDVDRQRLREDRVRDGLILKSKTCREHHAAGNLAADRRQALKQIERGKALYKLPGSRRQNFPICGPNATDISIVAVVGLRRACGARMRDFRHGNHHQPIKPSIKPVRMKF